MGANVDPLVVGRVIGDVVDLFVPSVSMSVYYASKHVNNGCDIKPSVAAEQPRVTVAGSSDELYTLVMTDPDAPSPSEPSLREWVHWIVTDIPGCSNVTRGKEILAYVGPKPTVGIHRYILVLFRQHTRLGIGILEAPQSRSNFNTRAFAQRFNLGMPVCTVYFNAHREPLANRKRYN
ncbi:Protein MOTHER of FT and TF 1 [Striga hermonthica]|uniref:Protein MOTHER of FT and TF 1 n=1 Tax=Striga hermonthica TaxID=68872 RepID=A0A9N7MY63_STRHE|nr:Protein MOTHER of FT and TF 1 [Striga hermonthica]